MEELLSNQECGPLWDKILSIVAESVSEDTFQRWFALTKLRACDEETIDLGIPNEIYRFWIEENHMTTLQLSLIHISEPTRPT